MNNKTVQFLSIFIVCVIVDQVIKYGFVFLDWGYDGPVISLVLAYNYGVAFSMFSFLEGNLKYIQIALIIGATIYLYFNKDILRQYSLAIALIFAGGISNIIDRFVHGGVVDYIFWHYKFEFAIFNFADIIIDLGVVIILYLSYKESKKEKTQLNKRQKEN